MNKQIAESKFIQFVSSLRPKTTQHVPHLSSERDKQMEPTTSIAADKILAVFLNRSPECSEFRNHLANVAVKIGPQQIVPERWNAVRDD